MTTNGEPKKGQKRFVVAGHIGNDDALALSQRTWCRTWTLTDRGMEAANRASMSQQAKGVSHAQG